MVLSVKVEGHDAFQKAVEDNKGKTMFVLFCGTKDKAGKSWCPDCVRAEPVVEEGLQGAADDAVFIYVAVGDRNTWKDPNCIFRTDPKLRLTSVPTLCKWGTPERLGDEDCSKIDLVKMLFEDD